MQVNRRALLVVAGVFLTSVVLLSVVIPGRWHLITGQTSPRSPATNSIPVADFKIWLERSFDTLSWEPYSRGNKLSRQILEQSLDLGRRFLVNNQNPQGNFNYEYDFINREISRDDSQVRQAGALWGLALIHSHKPDSATAKALDKGLDYFFKHSRQGPVRGSLLVAYPGETECKTGTIALVALAIIEYLRSEKTASVHISTVRRKELSGHLDGYLKFLQYLRLKDGHFSESFSLHSRDRSPRSNPYADGESLLCLTRAARYLGYTELIPSIEDSAIQMAKRYTIEAWQEEVDSPLTKGFYQWGSMAFWEYQDAGWKDADMMGDCIMVLAWWMIHTHRTLARQLNTAYAYEGIIHAYRLAKTRKLQDAAGVLASTIDTGLYKLTGWQVGGPLNAQNPFLLEHPTDDRLAIGGIMNQSAQATLRIDVTQHQMHAVILALNSVYPGNRETAN